MPKDAKFGLVLGVALVLLIAVLFFQRDRERAAATAATPAVSAHAVGTPAGTTGVKPAQPPASPTSSIYSVASSTTEP